MSIPTRRTRIGVVTVLLAVLLAGCANDPLAAQYRAGSGKNYIGGDGTITEIAAKNRGKPISFAGELETGEPTASTDYLGNVLVVNFWYAGCAPCRAEADDLQAVWEKYQGEGVAFLGVNVRDQVDTALTFATSYGITYPSAIDVNDGNFKIAFTGEVAANAVPTTLVLDRQGRVAARILGEISDDSILDAIVATVLSEPE
ncbi:TlpA disulfide reductase family protein [Plantibacter sp. T3]|uniref:TlpA family protein disulfide reductase n=1 Tax=Plantibacter sp. T3 TaxID=2653161 RepID=UPI0012F11D6E|nr:TlpA disulfide reductase family protein [Plantibacter sp. T3]VXB06404.1 Thiol:disulfide oxidoreductase related to ResA [Plantibacter sp. T3]